MRLGFGLGLQYSKLSGGGSGFEGILNQFPGASLGLSLELLDKDYSGFCIKVRRSSNNDELDIGFKDGVLDTATLLTFVGSGNAFVTIIYDQVGSNNMTQTTANLQGQIVSNGEVILIGGKPCIIRSAHNNGGYISTFAPNDGVAVKSMFYVGRNINVGRRTGMLGSNTGGQDYVLLVEGGSTATIFDSNVVITENKLNGVSTTFTNRDDAATKLEEQFLLYREIEFSFDDNVLGLGFRKINPSTFGMFTFQELVIFENTDDAVAKENNINERYNIY